jgi:hypothetical protein
MKAYPTMPMPSRGSVSATGPPCVVEGAPGGLRVARPARVGQDSKAVGRYWSTLSFVTTGA